MYRHARKAVNNKKYLASAVVLLVAGFAAIFTYFYYKESPVVPVQDSVQTQEPQEELIDYSVEGKYLYSGTVVLARAVEKFAVDSSGNRDYSQPFSKLKTFSPLQYDEWLVDLECPVTDEFVSYQQQIENLIFNCPVDFLPEMNKYITLINLANNHSSDRGLDGFEETQKNLEEYGFQHVGNYNPAVSEDVCEVFAIKVRLSSQSDNREARLPVAFCAWHYFFRDPLEGELEAMEKYAEIMPVFAFQHAGVEYVAKAGGNQPTIAKKIIDLGAEFVIGNSPHWVQNTEVYKGKLIAYSTGNFIFDQLEEETNRGANFELTISADYDENLKNWLELGESCFKDDDNCLELAKQRGLTKVDLDLEWDVIASNGGVRVVTYKSNAEVQAAVEERANWEDTLQALKNAEL